MKTPLLSIPYREIRAALISHGGSRVVPVLPRIRGRLVSFIATRSICSPPKCARGTCKEGREGKYGKSLDRWFGFDMIFPAQRCAPGNPPNPGVFSFYKRTRIGSRGLQHFAPRPETFLLDDRFRLESGRGISPRLLSKKQKKTFKRNALPIIRFFLCVAHARGYNH